MYLCLPARLVTLVEFRVFAELTGPDVSADIEGPTLLGVLPRVGLLEVGGVLLLSPGPKIDVLVGLRSLFGYILGPLSHPLGNGGIEVGCTEPGTTAGPGWVGKGPVDDVGGPDTSALSRPPNLELGSSKTG